MSLKSEEHPMDGNESRILMVLLRHAGFPPDARVEKEALGILGKGFSVTVLTLVLPGQKKFEEWRGIRIFRDTILSFRPVALRKAASLLERCIFFNPYWFFRIIKLARAENASLLHVHDLPFAPVTIAAGRFLGIPVVMDLHENYGAMVNFDKPVSFLDRLITRNRKVISLVERICLKMADHNIAVVEEAKERLVEAGAVPEKVTVVGNSADLDRVNSMKINPEIVSAYENRFVITYMGGGGRKSGIDRVIEAAASMKGLMPEILIQVITSGNMVREVENLAMEYNAADIVEVREWMEMSEAVSYVAASDAGIVYHYEYEQTHTTIPHKMFDFMALGIPIIVTDCAPLRRIVEKWNCGYVVKYGDMDALAVVLDKLHDKKHAGFLGSNGRKAVEEKYNFRNDLKALQHVYDLVLNLRNQEGE